MEQDRRVILITGSTSGIGEAAAVALARGGAHVVLHGRSVTRGEQVLARIRDAGGDASFLPADLSSLAGVERFAAQVAERFPRLDVLFNNAGAVHQTRQTSADGFELTFAVNHLAVFALTLRLAPLLRAAPAPRVITVASDAHLYAPLFLSDLQSRRFYFGFLTYGQTKSMNILFTRELARRAPDLRPVCFHPGVVRTGFALNEPGIVKLAWSGLSRVFAIPPERGAATGIRLAERPVEELVVGAYYARGRPRWAMPHATSGRIAGRLWAVSEELTGLTLGG